MAAAFFLTVSSGVFVLSETIGTNGKRILTFLSFLSVFYPFFPIVLSAKDFVFNMLTTSFLFCLYF